MSQSLPFSLDRTVAASWRLHLTGLKADGKSHWRTKIAYYAAVRDIVAAYPPRQLTWRSIVAAVRPRGSRSTFYDVTGRHAKHALIDALRQAPGADSLQLALCYRRSSAVEQLVDETKVWAFWPYRRGWIQQCQETDKVCVERATDALVAVLAEWARRNPDLAVALDHSPPACAVEDLVTMNQGQLPALRAHAMLGRVMRDAIRAGVYPEVVAAHLRAAPETPTIPTADTLVMGVAERIYAVTMELPRLAPSDATVVRDTVSELMADAVAGLRQT